MQDEIEHLGHIVDHRGVRVNPEKAAAIRAAQPPSDKQSLESWLGTAQYYSDFITGFSSLAAPLNELRRSGVNYEWTTTRRQAFEAIKTALADNTLRVHFDENRELILATDASPYGVGAVLMQQQQDGKEAMVTCASRTLSAA